MKVTESFIKKLELLSWWKVAVVVVLIFGGSLLFWFSIRPSIAYSRCHREAKDKAMSQIKTLFDLSKEAFNKEDYESYYKMCLRRSGIEK